jgi:pleiotropic regulator 1
MFLPNAGAPIPADPESQFARVSAKIHGEYNHVKDMPLPQTKQSIKSSTPKGQVKKPRVEPGPKIMDVEIQGTQNYPSENTVAVGPAFNDHSVQEAISEYESSQKSAQQKPQVAFGIVEYTKTAGINERVIGPGRFALQKYKKFQPPTWHAPWKTKYVISGHLGWVRCVAFEPGNEWFCTGSADRTIKLWDLATGTLKLSLTGHIATVRDLAVSDRHNYLFSCGEDKMVKCWDLEQNKSIRYYHGHLSGVYSLSLHPTLDVLVTGGRDSTARVWDIRTKEEIHVLMGHTNTVTTVKSQGSDPQVITGSADSTIKLWDLRTGKAITTLTNHKKGIRAMLIHPT